MTFRGRVPRHWPSLLKLCLLFLLHFLPGRARRRTHIRAKGHDVNVLRNANMQHTFRGRAPRRGSSLAKSCLFCLLLILPGRERRHTNIQAKSHDVNVPRNANMQHTVRVAPPGIGQASRNRVCCFLIRFLQGRERRYTNIRACKARSGGVTYLPALNSWGGVS